MSAKNLVVCFDEYAEAVCRGQVQTDGDVLDEILDPGVRRDLKYLKGDENRIDGSSGIAAGE